VKAKTEAFETVTLDARTESQNKVRFPERSTLSIAELPPFVDPVPIPDPPFSPLDLLFALTFAFPMVKLPIPEVP
jgi:hypothetical protein